MIDSAAFFSTIRGGPLFNGQLHQKQVDGINAIVACFETIYPTNADGRWLAYILATAYWETARTLQPISEFGRGRGHPYGAPDDTGRAPYGRGFVQLTWRRNYVMADSKLGLNGKLSANYELALDRDIASQIIIRGMAEGWFTDFKLSDYLNNTTADWTHCRRIVNGMDHAADISNIALYFFDAIGVGNASA